MAGQYEPTDEDEVERLDADKIHWPMPQRERERRRAARSEEMRRLLEEWAEADAAQAASHPRGGSHA